MLLEFQIRNDRNLSYKTNYLEFIIVTQILSHLKIKKCNNLEVYEIYYVICHYMSLAFAQILLKTCIIASCAAIFCFQTK